MIDVLGGSVVGVVLSGIFLRFSAHLWSGFASCSRKTRNPHSRHNHSVEEDVTKTERNSWRRDLWEESLFGILLDAEKALVMSPPMANPAKY